MDIFPEMKKFCRLREFFTVFLWYIIGMVSIDLSLYILFQLPEDIFEEPSAIVNYFNYGISVEKKLRRQIGPTIESTSLLARAGWINNNIDNKQKNANTSDKLQSITFYGMSFTNKIAEAFKKISPNFSVRKISGPGAPPNHSYFAFSKDIKANQSDIFVFGILASSVEGMMSMTGATIGFEGAAAYTYPIYRWKHNELEVTFPIISNLDDLRKSLTNDQLWIAWEDQLESNDSYYCPFLFKKNILDSSVIFRLIRRAWSKHKINKIRDSILSADGFDEKSNTIVTLKMLVKSFSSKAIKNGKLPIVLLHNNRGYHNHLFLALKSLLETNDIPYVSSHEIAPPEDPNSYGADNYHFKNEIDDKMAHKILEIIHSRYKTKFHADRGLIEEVEHFRLNQLDNKNITYTTTFLTSRIKVKCKESLYIT